MTYFCEKFSRPAQCNCCGCVQVVTALTNLACHSEQIREDLLMDMLL